MDNQNGMSHTHLIRKLLGTKRRKKGADIHTTWTENAMLNEEARMQEMLCHYESTS